ncbi:DUF1570 domain-containing protein [Aeoliella sp.]|uniref:DUF1570 domain-containing protein n=1 Tax=Aeoliella sp. TaxID=2795800 RepID=UPI003CCB8A14
MEQVSRRTFGKRALAAGAVAFGLARGAQAAPWWIDQRQVGPFICQSAFPLIEYQELLDELAPLERELMRVLAVQPCKTPIYLHLMANKRQHTEYIRERFPEVPYRQALFIKQNNRASVFAYKNDELDIDIRHECTHALLHADMPMVPLWLDEGLAEYFELAKDKRARHHSHLKKVKWDLKRKKLKSVAELEKEERLEDMTAADYRSSWAWVHFMLHGPVEAHAELVMFLNEIRNHTMPRALSQRLAEAVPNLSWRIQQHFAQL